MEILQELKQEPQLGLLNDCDFGIAAANLADGDTSEVSITIDGDDDNKHVPNQDELTVLPEACSTFFASI